MRELHEIPIPVFNANRFGLVSFGFAIAIMVAAFNIEEGWLSIAIILLALRQLLFAVSFLVLRIEQAKLERKVHEKHAITVEHHKHIHNSPDIGLFLP